MVPSNYLPLSRKPKDTPMAHDDGGQAVSSLSIRDYFAGQALMGLLAATGFDAPIEQYADTAYRLADALLAARGSDADDT